MKLAEKTKMVSASYTIGISTKVNEMNEMGRDIINLSVGEPDVNIPEKAKKSILAALDNNYTKYDKVPGLVQLRKAIAEKLKVENGLDYSLEEIVVTNGAKQAIMNTLSAVVNPGEEVIVLVPYWTSYPEIIKLCGCVPVIVYPENKKEYKITIEDIKKAVTEKTKMLFFNNPSNPAGIVYTKEEVKEIAEFCLEHKIWIMSDEIYERFCFDGDFISTASISEEIKNITILVNGLSKSAAMTGLRIGYTASSKEVAKAISVMQGHLTSHPSTISQWAASTALTECRDEINAQLDVFRQRRGLMMENLKRFENIDYLEPKGAFYIMVNFGAYKDKIPHEGSFSLALCEKMLEEAEVAAVPGIAFGLDDYVRISYAVSTENLEKGLERIEKFVNSLK